MATEIEWFESTNRKAISIMIKRKKLPAVKTNLI